MLVKHNLLDSFGVSGLVLVGFVSGLTKGGFITAMQVAVLVTFYRLAKNPS